MSGSGRKQLENDPKLQRWSRLSISLILPLKNEGLVSQRTKIRTEVIEIRNGNGN